MKEEKADIREKISGKELIEKNKKINKEINKLKKIFKELPKNRKEMSEKLIENAAFMSVTLDELKDDIKKYGVKETYVNGANQFGIVDPAVNFTIDDINSFLNILK